MIPEHVAKLLSTIDEIEADMRRLEGQLTRVRQTIWDSYLGGERGRYHMDGRDRRKDAMASREVPHDCF